MTTLRITLRQFRSELLVLAVMAAVATAAMLVITGLIAQLDLAACANSAASDLACQGRIARLQDYTMPASVFEIVAALVPPLAGILLGVGLVTHEVELNTASLSWSLSASRSRWFLRRVAVLAVAVIALAVGPIVATDVLLHAQQFPPVQNDSALAYQVRDGPELARALALFGVGLLVGTMSGRALPSLLLALLVGGILLAGIERGYEAWRRAEAVVLADPAGGLDIDNVPRDAKTGRILTWEEASAMEQAAVAPSPDNPDGFSGVEYVTLGIPAERVPEIIARETVGYLLAGAAFGLLALPVLARRRPS